MATEGRLLAAFFFEEKQKACSVVAGELLR
jgi:hypothetical protein